jgi:hypothetical protein
VLPSSRGLSRRRRAQPAPWRLARTPLCCLFGFVSCWPAAGASAAAAVLRQHLAWRLDRRCFVSLPCLRKKKSPSLNLMCFFRLGDYYMGLRFRSLPPPQSGLAGFGRAGGCRGALEPHPPRPVRPGGPRGQEDGGGEATEEVTGFYLTRSSQSSTDHCERAAVWL